MRPRPRVCYYKHVVETRTVARRLLPPCSRGERVAPADRIGGRRPARALRRLFVAVALLGSLAACGERRDAPISVLRPPDHGAGGPTAVGLQPGQHAPPFVVTTLDGQPLASGDLTARGRPFVLYFFATW